MKHIQFTLIWIIYQILSRIQYIVLFVHMHTNIHVYNFYLDIENLFWLCSVLLSIVIIPWYMSLHEIWITVNYKFHKWIDSISIHVYKLSIYIDIHFLYLNIHYRGYMSYKTTSSDSLHRYLMGSNSWRQLPRFVH